MKNFGGYSVFSRLGSYENSAGESTGEGGKCSAKIEGIKCVLLNMRQCYYRRLHRAVWARVLYYDLLDKNK